jgi:hypothetical protein
LGSMHSSLGSPGWRAAASSRLVRAVSSKRGGSARADSRPFVCGGVRVRDRRRECWRGYERVRARVTSRLVPSAVAAVRVRGRARARSAA